MDAVEGAGVASRPVHIRESPARWRGHSSPAPAIALTFILGLPITEGSTVSRLSPRAERLILWGVALCWLVAITVGLSRVWIYANTPGRPADAPRSWPVSSRLARDQARPTLVMLLHPQCTCSQASLGELAKLMTHVQGRVTAHVLFYRPPDAGPGWAQGDLRADAEAIPGVTVSTDIDGVESEKLGGYVSGQTFLFDPAGALTFDGGITFARGHAGDNAGRDALQALIQGESPLTHGTPVVGCYLGRPRDIT